MEEVTVLIKRSQEGDKEAREVLVEKNLGLVHHIVKRFAGRGYDLEDLFQIGSIGLMKAIDKFDLSFDVKFSTYAVPMITGEIKRFLRDDGLVKVSRSLKENGFKIRYAMEQFTKEKGREATLMEIAQLTGLTVEETVMALEANVEVESIYKTVYQGDGSEIFLVDKVVAGGTGVGQVGNMSDSGGDAEKERLLNNMLIKQLLEELGEEERSLIIMRYFENKTQVEVAKILGTNQVQVSRMEKRILLRMRGRAIQ